MDTNAFLADLANQPWESLTQLDVHQMAEKFNSFLTETLNRHAPLKTRTKKNSKKPEPSTELRRLRKERNQAQKEGKTVELRQLRRECNKKTRQEHFAHLNDRINRGETDLWRVIKENLGSEQPSSCLSYQDEGKDICQNEIAESFNKFFKEKIKKVRSQIEPFQGDCLRGARSKAAKLHLQEDFFKFRAVKEKETLIAIQKSKKSKCPDYFGIAPAVIKIAASVIIIPLTWIINEALLSGTVPKCWKTAKILPLFKKKDKTQIQNYRPISILPSPSKIMEQVVKTQLEQYFEDKNILPQSQYGFRQRLSTIHALAAATHDWQEATQAKQNCGALLFDLTAAFDCIDATLLEAKFRIHGVSWSAIKWLHSYLTDRQQTVDINNQSSKVTAVGTGSPQGSVISPLLFSIMIADLDEWISTAKALNYADDTTCYASGHSKDEVRGKLEQSAKEVLRFMQANNLSANPSKTQFIMFSCKAEDPLKVGDIYIEESKSIELLGVLFNKQLNWTTHLQKLESDIRKRIGIIRRLSWRLPQHLVKQMIDPLFTSKLRYSHS